MRLLRRSPLAVALFIASQAAFAQTPPHQDEHRHANAPFKVGVVKVSASPLKSSIEDLTQPVAVLTAESLDKAKAATLGETVAGIPGVQSSSFGPGVGRPIIRGMDGARVQVMSNGMGTGDVSAVSNDHAVALEPFLADQVEVLKGPATLMYGGGAVGGAVNVTDGRIPESANADPHAGRSEIRYNTVNRERTAMARLDGTGMDGRFAVHVDGVYRDAGNTRIPGYADIHGDDDDHDVTPGILNNSYVHSRSGSLGASWIFQRGFVGAAASQYHSEYGIPEGAHVHDDPGHHHDEEPPVHIVLDQRRQDAKAAIRDVGIFAAIRPAFSNIDYTHTEFEGNEPGTVFTNRTREFRTDFLFRKAGAIEHAAGFALNRERQQAVGDEAFIPSTENTNRAVYWYGNFKSDPLIVDLAVRAGRNTIDVVDQLALRRGMSTLSGALSARYRLTQALSITGGLDRAERAPGVEELFALGPHIATQTYEVGDADLGVERANRGEIGLSWKSRQLRGSISGYRAKFANFTYLHDTGNEVDHLAERQWMQAPATFTGIDAELNWTVANNATGQWDWRIFGDRVRAKFDDGGNVPRMAPSRVGSELSWFRGDWRASVISTRVAATRNLAAGETPTAGYTLLNAHVAWHHDLDNGLGLEIFADGTNLLNSQIRNATSFLKDTAPQAGRGVAFGVRTYF